MHHPAPGQTERAACFHRNNFPSCRRGTSCPGSGLTCGHKFAPWHRRRMAAVSSGGGGWRVWSSRTDCCTSVPLNGLMAGRFRSPNEDCGTDGVTSDRRTSGTSCLWCPSGYFSDVIQFFLLSRLTFVILLTFWWFIFTSFRANSSPFRSSSVPLQYFSKPLFPCSPSFTLTFSDPSAASFP